MSWWDVGGGGVIGDGPADILTIALSTAAQEREEAGRRKPRLASVLAGMSAALGAHGDAAPRLFAKMAGGDHVSADSSGEDVAILLREALAEIERQYRERWERPPSRRELLETLHFVLVGVAGSFLRDIKAEEILGIVEA